MKKKIPHGRSHYGGKNDRGSWGNVPDSVKKIWNVELNDTYQKIITKHKRIADSNSLIHLGTLGSGNHFIEICRDEKEYIWIMLHSGSRGVGNKIGTHFIDLAKQEMKKQKNKLPDINLAYFHEGTEFFNDYYEAAGWAQKFAKLNRRIMMNNAIASLASFPGIPAFDGELEMVDCHHNYVEHEMHFGKEVFVTRKGAVRARRGELGIIPGSMGACSYIVKGLGNSDSFQSCSHGAGRMMSRTEAKRRFFTG